MALHSKYRPQAEADRFAHTLSYPYPPDYIVLTEPGESYLASSLRKRFPQAKLICIRYSETLFLDTDCLWDFIYRPNAQSSRLSFFLLNIIPDEFFPNTVFLSWKPADLEWPQEAKKTWKEINTALELFKSLIYTRTAFGKIWLKNVCTNIIFAKNIAAVQFPKSDFLFFASGFSLEQNMPLLARLKLPSIAAGSCVDALRYHRIPITACISTDGTFWARQLLKNIDARIPLLFPLEAAVPKSVLKKNMLGILSYGSFLEKYFFSQLGIPSLSAKRNGTVSGTAIELLLEHSTQQIYCFGLDLGNGKSFSHARPHASITALDTESTKLRSIETFLCAQHLANGSLATYRAWFENLNDAKAKRILRVGLQADAAKLSKVKTLARTDIEIKNITAQKIQEPLNFTGIQPISARDRKSSVVNCLNTAKTKIESMSLRELIMSHDATLQFIKELIEFTAYHQLMNFIKTGSFEHEARVKTACCTELIKLENKLKSI